MKNKTDDLFDELLRPSVYKKRISSIISHALSVRNSLFDNSKALKTYVEKNRIPKDSLNHFASETAYANKLLQLAYAEECLSQAYEKNEGDESKIEALKGDIFIAFVEAGKFSDQAKDKGAFLGSIEDLAKNPPLDSTKNNYVCYPELKRLAKKLSIDLIEPAFLCLDIDAVEGSQLTTLLSAQISEGNANVLRHVLECISMRRHFKSEFNFSIHNEYFLYLSVIHYCIHEEIVNSDLFLDFYCKYMLEFNALNQAASIGLKSKTPLTFKNEQNDITTFGKHITIKSSHCDVIEVKVKSRVFTLVGGVITETASS